MISGAMKLDLKWMPYKDGIMQAKTPAGLEHDQLFVNGQPARHSRDQPLDTFDHLHGQAGVEQDLAHENEQRDRSQ